ncbi:AN1-type zinc finger protein 4 [Pelobates fuscus]|uniref:AN1-type zinc finger protein 4 n=1 Tax=Pelobates fuscus TaxID=191477 RepID=UPI002FE47CB1
MANKKEPPFFNGDNIGSFLNSLTFYSTMELFIETLTGTCFELRVSPFEKVVCVKAKIQRLEGIPVSQQHLIWNNVELEDERTLKDYNISKGCTLKLVLAMRGGPINTRRVPLEDPIREIAEYIDPVQDETWDKSPSNKQVTFLVYREGDQLKFFRVVDRGDGTLTPLSESVSGGSVYNLNDEDEAEASQSGQQIIENSITMNKMKFLKSKMESMNLNKKPKKTSKFKPRPPMAPRPSSTLLASARHRFLKVLPDIGQSCLPPGNPLSSESSQIALSSLTTAAKTNPSIAGDYINRDDSWTTSLLAPSPSSIVLPPKISRVELESSRHSKNTYLSPVSILAKKEEPATQNDSVLYQNTNFFATEESSMAIGESFLLTEVGPTEQYEELYNFGKVKPEFALSEGCKETPATETSHKTLPKSLNSEAMETGLLNGERSPPRNKFLSPIHFSSQITHKTFPKPQRQHNVFEFGSLRPTASHMCRSVDIRNMSDGSFSRSRFRGVKVDSPGKRSDVISKMEARDMTEVANKASKEPVGSLNNLEFFASLARSRSRDNLQSSNNPVRLRTSSVAQTSSLQNPLEEHFKKLSPLKDNAEFFISPHGPGESLHNTASGKRLVEATHLFPPVKSTLRNKKKTTKHCFFCRKKTGLATSFDCRCGNNFCATHRYAETHNCSYDYKTAGRQYLQEACPVVTAPKLPKI